MKVHIGVYKDSGLIQSVLTTAVNVQVLPLADDLVHGEEEVVYTDMCYQGIQKRPEIEGKKAAFLVAVRPGKRRSLPDTPDGSLLKLLEAAKAHVHAKGEHPFRMNRINGASGGPDCGGCSRTDAR